MLHPGGMADRAPDDSPLPAHGSPRLPAVEVDSYNLAIEDDEGFVGDRASKGAFVDILDKWREPLREMDADPLGETPSKEVSKKKLDQLLAEGDPEAAGLVHSAVEDFAQALTGVIRRFLKAKGWKDTEGIVIGGGFRASRVGELAVGRTAVLLKADGVAIEFHPIRSHPDEAGLIGAVHLMPSWMIEGYDGILAVDIGGTNIRVGVVESNLAKADDLSKARVWKSDLWRHGDETTKRDAAVERLVEMVQDLIGRAGKAKLSLAPVIGVGCPGRIDENGSIEEGARNLPGNWESSRFNLPTCIREAIPEIGAHETLIVMHNDAVLQGLSELPFMRDYERWGVLTIGTGLGNARFTNRRKTPAEKRGRKG
jgi:predicted NBD/HSP70 family sugar kinase